VQILEERKYTVSQVAKILNCSRSQVLYLINSGQLRAFKIKKKENSRGVWRVYESAVIEFMIENDSFVEFLGISDFSNLDERTLLEKLKKKIFRLASRRY
jgi:excisionase family DNA binding protein